MLRGNIGWRCVASRAYGAKGAPTFGSALPEVVNGIKGAIDFLQANIRVQKVANLPFSTILVPLSAFFAVPQSACSGYRPAACPAGPLVWRACFSPSL